MPPFGFGRRKDEPAFAEVYLELRSMVLGLEPSAADMRPTPELRNVWGVVVDWGMENGVGTFVALVTAFRLVAEAQSTTAAPNA
jgi:hypothetical protein